MPREADRGKRARARRRREAVRPHQTVQVRGRARVRHPTESVWGSGHLGPRVLPREGSCRGECAQLPPGHFRRRHERNVAACRCRLDRWRRSASTRFGSRPAIGSSRFPGRFLKSSEGDFWRAASTRSKTSSRPRARVHRSLSTWPTRRLYSSSCSRGSTSSVKNKLSRLAAYSLSGTRFGLTSPPAGPACGRRARLVVDSCGWRQSS
jgi:hypothetical protein